MAEGFWHLFGWQQSEAETLFLKVFDTTPMSACVFALVLKGFFVCFKRATAKKKKNC